MEVSESTSHWMKDVVENYEKLESLKKDYRRQDRNLWFARNALISSVRDSLKKRYRRIRTGTVEVSFSRTVYLKYRSYMVAMKICWMNDNIKPGYVITVWKKDNGTYSLLHEHRLKTMKGGLTATCRLFDSVIAGTFKEKKDFFRRVIQNEGYL